MKKSASVPGQTQLSPFSPKELAQGLTPPSTTNLQRGCELLRRMGNSGDEATAPVFEGKQVLSTQREADSGLAR